jgi:hypothetical protein
MINVEEALDATRAEQANLQKQLMDLNKRVEWLTDVIYQAFPSLSPKVTLNETYTAGSSEREDRPRGRISR